MIWDMRTIQYQMKLPRGMSGFKCELWAYVEAMYTFTRRYVQVCHSYFVFRSCLIISHGNAWTTKLSCQTSWNTYQLIISEVLQFWVHAHECAAKWFQLCYMQRQIRAARLRSADCAQNRRNPVLISVTQSHLMCVQGRIGKFIVVSTCWLAFAAFPLDQYAHNPFHALPSSMHPIYPSVSFPRHSSLLWFILKANLQI